MINNLILQGRLVKDPETRQAGNATVCDFTVAWNEKYGENENTLFLNCQAWNKTGEMVSNYFTKGKEIIIEAQLRTETFEKDGEKKSIIKARVNKVHFTGKKEEPELEPINDDGSLPFWEIKI